MAEISSPRRRRFFCNSGAAIKVGAIPQGFRLQQQIIRKVVRPCRARPDLFILGQNCDVDFPERRGGDEEMNGEDTLALWRRGKGAWETWGRSLSDRKDALTAAGKWSVDCYGEGQNDETKAWLQDATADFTDASFDAEADFAGINFPGRAEFEGARFVGTANFAGATFTDDASFERAQFGTSSFAGTKFQGLADFGKARFGTDACFEKAEFLRISDLATCARFYHSQFEGNAAFAGALFAGTAEFLKAAFAAASFDRCEFQGDALFTSAQFAGAASFVKTRFTGSCADFAHCIFNAETRFLEAHFGDSWARLVMSGACSVSFEAVCFEKDATFRQTWFVGESEFRNALFNGLATFDDAQFVMPASFAPVVFSARTSFKDVRFGRDANFADAQFLEECDFTSVKFSAKASFTQVRFFGTAQFVRGEFMGDASFRGVTAEAALVLDGSRCVAVPDFSEGTFAQGPALDRLIKIKPKWRLLHWWPSRRRHEQSLSAHGWRKDDRRKQ
jgi:Pentapeptide repeats (9 copies)